MIIENILGVFSDLQKFSSIKGPEAVVQEFSEEENAYNLETGIDNITTTFKIQAEISSFGERKISFQKDVEKTISGSSYVHSARSTTWTISLKELADKVEQLNYGAHSTPKQHPYVPPEKRRAVYDITARICELYKVTDHQVADAPFYTRAYCGLTENCFFPEYRLRHRLEKGEYRRPLS